MLIIDCDTHFGFHASSTEDASVEKLLAIEKGENVDYVLACSLKGRTYDAREGNDDTLAVSRKHPHILPVATVDPRAHYGVESEIQRCADLGFVGLRVYPELQGWSIDSLLFRRIVDACAACRLPLLVSADSPGKASAIVEHAQSSSSPIILLNAKYNTQAEAMSSVAERPNTYLGTRLFLTPGAMEAAVEAVGADRLVMGSDAPAYGVRQAISMVLRSELGNEDKAKILGGNIARLIAPQLHKLGRTLTEYGELANYERKCVRGPIIDVHGHLGPWPFPMRNRSASELAELMRRRGIEKCVLSCTKAIVNDFVEGNAELDREIADVDGLYGYVTLNPNYPEACIAEMKKYLDKPKFVGLKLHPAYTRVQIDSDASRAIAQIAACKPVPYLIHTHGFGEPTKIGNLAQEFPELPIIMGHGGANAWREALEVVKETNNTYVEFCSSTCVYGKVREAIDTVGAQRVLFGSDAGLFDPAFNLGTYEEADLTPCEEEAVMRGNARRLFGFE